MHPHDPGDHRVTGEIHHLRARRRPHRGGGADLGDLAVPDHDRLPGPRRAAGAVDQRHVGERDDAGVHGDVSAHFVRQRVRTLCGERAGERGDREGQQDGSQAHGSLWWMGIATPRRIASSCPPRGARRCGSAASSGRDWIGRAAYPPPSPPAATRCPSRPGLVRDAVHRQHQEALAVQVDRVLHRVEAPPLVDQPDPHRRRRGGSARPRPCSPCRWRGREGSSGLVGPSTPSSSSASCRSTPSARSRSSRAA